MHHSIGNFFLKLGTLRECPAKWLDRKLEEKRVEEIARVIEEDHGVVHNGQPWLAIADLTKRDLAADKNLIKGANLELVGGLHRHAAMKKVNDILFTILWFT